MKKFLALFVFAGALTSFAQTFDQQAANAHAGVQALQTAAETKVAEDAAQLQLISEANAKLTDQNATLSTQNTALLSQFNLLQSTVAYNAQEWWAFSANSAKAVGGSGLGKATQQVADERSLWAQLAVTPDPPIAPATTNYFDCYYTHKFLPDATKKFYRLEATWQFPTAADASAANALEMEVRQVLPGGNMFVPAFQLRFRDHTLRYFDHGAPGDNWVNSGVTVPTFVAGQPVTIVLEAHRDDAGTTVFYDAVTINGVRKPLAVTEATYNDGWGPRLSNSVQLDANTKAFKVNVRGVRLTSW